MLALVCGKSCSTYKKHHVRKCIKYQLEICGQNKKQQKASFHTVMSSLKPIKKLSIEDPGSEWHAPNFVSSCFYPFEITNSCFLKNECCYVIVSVLLYFDFYLGTSD